MSWKDKVVQSQERAFKVTRPKEDFKLSKDFLFRGQPESGMPLRSSFDRVMEKHSLSNNNYIGDRFLYFMHEFSVARIETGLGGGLINYDAADDTLDPSMLELAARAQHMGLPTRLLDWSKSPYVAAFFAFLDEEPSSGDAAIWCLDSRRIADEKCIRPSNVSIWPLKVNGSSRQIAQHGAFSLNLTKEMDLENILKRNSLTMERDPGTEILYKLLVPRTERLKVLDDLSLMRINYLSLFPDEDGVVRHLKWRLLEKDFSSPSWAPPSRR